MAKTDNLTLEIDPDLKERLTALAMRSGRSLAELTRRVLRDHVDAQENALAERAEDEARWQRYLKTGETVSLGEMRARLRANAVAAAQQQDGR